MLYWHRLIAFCGLVLLLFVVCTGVGVQLADMRALVTHAPATDPDMLMMRQHITGTPGFAVLSPPDYTAPALPPRLDYATALEKTAALGRAAAPGAPMKLVEVRDIDGKLAGHVQMGGREMIFDLASGTRLPDADVPHVVDKDIDSSTRLYFKKLHQFRWAGRFGTGWSGLAGICFAVLIFTGLSQYFRVLKSRRDLGRKGVFWRAGGWFRDLHRVIAVCASVVIIWIVVTGFALSLDDFSASVLRLVRPPQPNAFNGDVSSPLQDAELPGMARVTLAAFQHVMPDTGLKALRLRYYAGYAQGVVIAANPSTSQLVFNARTGARMSMQEPGYPDFGFPSGWDWHQRLKRLHRGDFFGMTGRWLATLGGLSLLYLGISGPIMYWQMWNRRRAKGKPAPIWG